MDAAPAPLPTLVPGCAGPMPVVHHRPPGEPRGAALILHGRNGAASSAHLGPAIDVALARGLAVAVPDLCHSSANDSPGEASAFTMSAHLADAAAVLDALTPTLPRPAPLILVGHSMGAYAALRLAAEAKARTVTGVLALSPVVSGAALLAARAAMGPDALLALRAELPGAEAEWPTHDALPIAATLGIPVAVIVGADDTVTPPADAARLAAALSRCVHHQVIPGEHHCPLSPAFAASIARAFDALLREDALTPRDTRRAAQDDPQSARPAPVPR